MGQVIYGTHPKFDKGATVVKIEDDHPLTKDPAFRQTTASGVPVAVPFATAMARTAETPDVATVKVSGSKPAPTPTKSKVDPAPDPFADFGK